MTAIYGKMAESIRTYPDITHLPRFRLAVALKGSLGVAAQNAICLPNMPCSLPRWTEPVLVSVASRLVLPSPFPRRVGVHDFAFEACSSFTRVTACRVARPPYSGLCHEASTRPVTRPGRSLATMFTDNYMGGSFPHWQTAPVRRTRKFWLERV